MYEGLQLLYPSFHNVNFGVTVREYASTSDARGGDSQENSQTKRHQAQGKEAIESQMCVAPVY